METLRIFLFGKFRVRLANRELEDLNLGKAQELFWYLLLNRHHPHYRESIVNVLWNDVSAVHSRGYLRKALWQLRNALDSHSLLEKKSFLLVESDWIQLNPLAKHWIDVSDFEEVYKLVQGVPGRDLPLSTIQTLQRVVELYCGDLLEGCYYEWCLIERERLQQMYLIMLDKLMDYCEAYNQYETGLDYGLRILRIDRARERTHRRLMRLHYQARNRTEALRQGERCITILQEELGVGLAERTRTLYEQIKADRLIIPTSRMGMDNKTTNSAPLLLLEVLQQLKQLEVELSGMQGRVQRKIETVEMILNGQ